MAKKKIIQKTKKNLEKFKPEVLEQRISEESAKRVKIPKIGFVDE